MISEDKFSAIVGSLTDWLKNKKKRPYYSESHKKRSEISEALSYHAEFGVFPDKLIGSAAPNETKLEFDYRKANYKQVTKPIWDKALSATYRIFNEQNYSISYEDQDAKDYLTYLYPIHGSFIEYFKEMVHPEKFADPNTVIGVKPAYIPGTIDDTGEFKVDQSAMIEPIAVMYDGDDVIIFHHEYILVESEEKSVVRFNGRDEKSGYIFELYDDTNIYLIVQVGDKIDYTFEVSVYYEHGYEQVPAWPLKGIPEYDEEMIYYSHFMCALPNLDQAALLSSTAFAVVNKISFPTRWYYEDKCGSCSGNGYTIDYADGGKHLRCGECGGSGHRFTFTFGKDYVIPTPENVASTDTTQLPTPPFGVVDPPVESIKYLDSKVKELLETSFMNLQIDVASQPNGQTATESKIDRDEFFSFLVKISGEEFYLMQEVINAITWMRYGQERVVTVNAPNEFEMRSSADLTEELKTATESKLPAPYLFNLLKDSIKQRFKNDSVMLKIVELVGLIDPLMNVPDNTVQTLVSSGVTDKWRETLHYCIYNFIYSEQEKDEQFIYKDIEVIKKTVEDMAKAATVSTTGKANDIFNTL